MFFKCAQSPLLAISIEAGFTCSMMEGFSVSATGHESLQVVKRWPNEVWLLQLGKAGQGSWHCVSSVWNHPLNCLLTCFSMKFSQLLAVASVKCALRELWVITTPMDTHQWSCVLWETLNVNITLFVYRKKPQGPFRFQFVENHENQVKACVFFGLQWTIQAFPALFDMASYDWIVVCLSLANK